MPESIESFQEKSVPDLAARLVVADSHEPKSIEEEGLFGIMERIVTGDTEK